MKIYTTDGGFIWVLIDPEYSEKENYIGVAYCVYEDESEALIESDNDWDAAHAFHSIALELGWEYELKADWQESRERNNDNRSFESWLEDKVELLIS